MSTQSQAQPRTIRPGDAVRTILLRPVASVDVAESMASVAEWLAADEVGAVVVTAPYGPVGVVSERDIVQLVAARADLAGVEAGEAMSPDLVVGQDDETIAAIAARMLECGIRHVPIMRGNRLVGIVSMRDVLAVMVG